MEKKRTPYRPDQRLALQRIESARIKMGITRSDLCLSADLSTRTYRRMCTSGRGFDRHIRALRFALRTIEQRRRAAEQMFSEIADV